MYVYDKVHGGVEIGDRKEKEVGRPTAKSRTFMVAN